MRAWERGLDDWGNGDEKPVDFCRRVIGDTLSQSALKSTVCLRLTGNECLIKSKAS